MSQIVDRLPDTKGHENMFVPLYQQVLYNRNTGEYYPWNKKMANDTSNGWDTVTNPKAIIRNGKLQNPKVAKASQKDFLKSLKSHSNNMNMTDESIRLRLELEEKMRQIRNLGYDPHTMQKLESSEGVDSSNETLTKQRNRDLAKELMPDEVVAKMYGDKVKSPTTKKKPQQSDEFAAKLAEVEELESREDIDAFVEDNFSFKSAGAKVSDIRIIKALKAFYSYEYSVADLEERIGAEKPFVEDSDVQAHVNHDNLKVESTNLGATANEEITPKDVAKMQKTQLWELMEKDYGINIEDVKMNFMALRKAVKNLVAGETNIENFLKVVPGSKTVVGV